MLALFLAVLCLPVTIMLAVLVAATSRGPVFYKQVRVGFRGRPFWMVKFRTMVTQADKMDSSVTKNADSRITRTGRVLRKTKLDELPQLWNVLKGDMSFVGPRPDVPEIVQNYSEDMKKILNIRPGITSNASLLLRDEAGLLRYADNPDSAYEKILVPVKVGLAMEHLNRHPFRFDMAVLIKTAWVLTIGRLYITPEANPVVQKIMRDIAMLNREQRSGDAWTTAKGEFQ